MVPPTRQRPGLKLAFRHLMLVHFNRFEIEDLLRGIITIDFSLSVTVAGDKDNRADGLKPH
jgi:hypothetical protein